jgi:PD-(D/E)XK nuclease superfamily
MTFLQKTAHYIFNKYSDPKELENICVILPTRRAVYFFKRALAQCSDRPFLAPEVVAIDDFVTQKCGIQIADPVSLLFELFDVYKQVDGSINFEKFLGWASVLLQDFDKIDQYMVDPKFLFEYITEARAIERWRVDWPNSNVHNESATTKNYFELFANLSQVYLIFRQQLQSQSRAYRGMAYRILAENAFELLLNTSPSEGSGVEKAQKSEAEMFFFVGFNALSKSESVIFQTLIKAKRAECLWDTDTYYMRDNGRIEGGQLLRAYKEAGWAGPWNWTENYLTGQAREIHTYAVPNASMQTKVAGHLYDQWQKEGFGGTDEAPAAIVLADENLLIPMLYSLNENVTDLNVTMGLSLRNSLLFTLIDALFELQFTVGEFRTKEGKGIKIPKFNHRTVEKVLNHPFIRRYEFLALQNKDAKEQTIIQRTIRHIQQNNIVYLDPKTLFELGENHALFQALFSRWDNNPYTIIHAFYTLIDLLREVYKETQNAVETEYLFLFYTLLKQLETTLIEEHVEKLNLRTFRAFLYELIRQTKIPFSGEPLSALQVLGMLETRTLDFERIIILSMNEGVLPSSKRQNSLIPFDIAREVGLPVHSDQDAVMSYHFYRLLQRAKEVHLVYTTDPNAYNGGEASRFILQIEHELSKFPDTQTVFKQHLVAFEEASENSIKDIAKAEKIEWNIPKNTETLAFLKRQLTEKGLYATHLSQYLKCSLQYYFNRVVGVTEDEEVEDKIGPGEFGSWVHKVLERTDIEYFILNKTPSDEQIEALLMEEFKNMFGSYDADAGTNHLLYQVARQVVLDFLGVQIKEQTQLKVLATERKLVAPLAVQLPNENIVVQVAGKIDRIELIGNLVRVADYKTGKIAKFTTIKPEKVEEVLLHSTDNKHEKIRQLWLYKYLLYKQMLSDEGLLIASDSYKTTQYSVTSGFYSLRNIKEGYIENPIRFSETETAENFVEESEKYLTYFVSQKLLNPDEPFAKTNDLNICKYCDYRGICGR